MGGEVLEISIFTNWISFALELNSVVSLACRLREEHIAVRHILEYLQDDNSLDEYLFHFSFLFLLGY